MSRGNQKQRRVFDFGFDFTRRVVGEASGKGKYREVHNDVAVLEREGKSIKYQIRYFVSHFALRHYFRKCRKHYERDVDLLPRINDVAGGEILWTLRFSLNSKVIDCLVTVLLQIRRHLRTDQWC